MNNTPVERDEALIAGLQEHIAYTIETVRQLESAIVQLTWTDNCRRLATIDLTLRAANMLANGDTMMPFRAAIQCAANIVNYDRPEKDYRAGLGWCGVPSPAIDAAVKAILVTGGEIPIRLIVHPLDCGHLGNVAASAGGAVVDCGKALARAHGSPKATSSQVRRAEVDLERAEAAKVAASAALDAVGRFGSVETPHSTYEVGQ